MCSSQHSSYTPQLPWCPRRPFQALHSGFWQQNVWISHLAFLRSPFPQFTLVQRLATVPANGSVAQSYGSCGNPAIRTLVTSTCGSCAGGMEWGLPSAQSGPQHSHSDFREETRKAATASAFFTPFLSHMGWGERGGQVVIKAVSSWFGFLGQALTRNDGDWLLAALEESGSRRVTWRWMNFKKAKQRKWERFLCLFVVVCFYLWIH